MHDYQKNIETLNLDAWSDGQMRSKLWLCDLIEKDFQNKKEPLDIWIMGSWYGLLAQFLLIRGRLPLKRFRLFDMDPEAIRISQKMLNHWLIKSDIEIHHHLQDCTQIPERDWSTPPNILINTSTEHFENEKWMNFPSGIYFYAQSTNMEHPTHINKPTSLDDFKKRLGPITRMTYADKMEFRYPNFEFDRYMIAGIR